MSIFDINNKRIFVAGHQGMVGTAIVEKLKKEDCEILTIPKSEVDLMNQHEVNQWMKKNSPDAVIICAAKVGGILANNSFPAEFIYNNIMIAANLIHASHLTNVEKLVFLGSSCIYPKGISRPITEKDLLTSELESTNQWYAIAKISGIIQERSIDVMITRLRQKLEINPKNPKYLQTIRGSGYVLWIE